MPHSGSITTTAKRTSTAQKARLNNKATEADERNATPHKTAPNERVTGYSASWTGRQSALTLLLKLMCTTLTQTREGDRLKELLHFGGRGYKRAAPETEPAEKTRRPRQARKLTEHHDISSKRPTMAASNSPSVSCKHCTPTAYRAGGPVLYSIHPHYQHVPKETAQQCCLPSPGPRPGRVDSAHPPRNSP